VGSSPRSMKWYEAGHYSLNKEERSDRLGWMRVQLELKDIPQF